MSHAAVKTSTVAKPAAAPRTTVKPSADRSSFARLVAAASRIRLGVRPESLR